jgi:CheY-like chemotaxis protein
MTKELFIVDDDPIHRMIISKMIHIMDSSLTVEQFENGEIALTKLEKIKGLDHQVIVLLDINMPVLDGWGFLEKIEKCDFYDLQKLVIYIVSSSTDKSDISKSSQYKFVKGFLHKPLSTEDISTIISVE